ncbi:hypothetical protein [Sinomonas sp. R1AF57]|uniref:hypothetical protein n=1 Tax=Sinomonas sp. R1AF57 TaxID=2020377 RepID=UPI001C9D1AFB|nr:hypothetical protein [Sinomonas sp. R1AF57]
MLGVALVVGVVVPLGLAVLTRSIAIPHNDAWSHAIIGRTFAETGQIVLVGWNRSSLVGQIVALGPLAGSVVAEQVWVAIMAAVGLIATQRFVTARGGDDAGAFAALAVAAVPEFGLLGTSYMADMPAFVAVILAATVADTALASSRQWVLSVALAVGLWGVTIREQALIAPVAIGLAAVWIMRGRSRVLALVQSIAFGVAFIVFELWRRSLPFGDPPSFQPSVGHLIAVSVAGAFTLGLIASPLILGTRVSLNWRHWATWVFVPASVAVSAIWVVVRWPNTLMGNYMGVGGAYAAASVGTRKVLPDGVWAATMALAVLSAGMVCAILLRALSHLWQNRRRQSNKVLRDPLPTLMLSMLLIGTLIQAAMGQEIFSRYFLPVVPLAAALLMPFWRTIPRIAYAAVTINVGLGLLLTSDALSYDAARWQAAEQLVAQGVPPTAINAGLEWIGTHAELPADRRGLETHPNSALPRILNMFPESTECYVISGDPTLQLPQVAGLEYRRWGVSGRAQVYVYAQRPCR